MFMPAMFPKVEGMSYVQDLVPVSVAPSPCGSFEFVIYKK